MATPSALLPARPLSGLDFSRYNATSTLRHYLTAQRVLAGQHVEPSDLAAASRFFAESRPAVQPRPDWPPVNCPTPFDREPGH